MSTQHGHLRDTEQAQIAATTQLDGPPAIMYSTSHLNNLPTNIGDANFYGDAKELRQQQYCMQPGVDPVRLNIDMANGANGTRSFEKPMSGLMNNGPDEMIANPAVSRRQLRHSGINYAENDTIGRDDSPPDAEDDEDDQLSEAELDDDDDMVAALASGMKKPFSKKNLKRHRYVKKGATLTIRLSHSETRFLLNEFVNNPHPDAAQRGRLSKQVPGLSSRQIQVWFQNRRAKLKRMSAPDAERLLNSRSYPEGYGPAGFNTNAGVATTSREQATASPYMQPVEGVYATQVASHSEREQIVFNSPSRPVTSVSGQPNSSAYPVTSQMDQARTRSYARSALPQPIYIPQYSGTSNGQDVRQMAGVPHTPQAMPGLSPYSMQSGRPVVPFSYAQSQGFARPVANYNPMAFPPQRPMHYADPALPPPMYHSRVPDQRHHMEDHLQSPQPPIHHPMQQQVPLYPQQQLQQQAYPHAMYGSMISPTHNFQDPRKADFNGQFSQSNKMPPGYMPSSRSVSVSTVDNEAYRQDVDRARLMYARDKDLQDQARQQAHQDAMQATFDSPQVDEAPPEPVGEAQVSADLQQDEAAPEGVSKEEQVAETVVEETAAVTAIEGVNGDTPRTAEVE